MLWVVDLLPVSVGSWVDCTEGLVFWAVDLLPVSVGSWVECTE